METHFKCSGNGTKQAFCINNVLRCNGLRDCPNGEDELNCPKNCKQNEVRMPTLWKLSTRWRDY